MIHVGSFWSVGEGAATSVTDTDYWTPYAWHYTGGLNLTDYTALVTAELGAGRLTVGQALVAILLYNGNADAVPASLNFPTDPEMVILGWTASTSILRFDNSNNGIIVVNVDYYRNHLDDTTSIIASTGPLVIDPGVEDTMTAYLRRFLDDV